MSKRNPEEISAGHDPVTPDQPAGIPTGGETTTKRPAKTTNATTAKTPATEQDVLEEVQQIAADYYERLADLTADFAEQARGYVSSGQAYAREHPSGTLLGGFAVGVIIGALLGRR